MTTTKKERQLKNNFKTIEVRMRWAFRNVTRTDILDMIATSDPEVNMFEWYFARSDEEMESIKEGPYRRTESQSAMTGSEETVQFD